MTLLWKRSSTITAQDLIPGRPAVGNGAATVTADTAMRHSAVWAALRLRADLVSTLPVDCYRRVGGIQVEVAPTPFIADPGGDGSRLAWMYGSQVDLDRYGNSFGIITARDPAGYPQRVELAQAGRVSVTGKGQTITSYRVDGMTYEPADVWHERQHTIAGLPLGLAPLAYAAWSVGTYLSAQQFAADWFGSGAAPTGHLRNTAVKVIPDEDAAKIKAKFKSAVQSRDVLVTGADWTYDMAAVPANTIMFLDTMRYGLADVARFLGVPADMIDAESSSSSITYANITQRNLQFLILNLGPAIIRREEALSSALPRPRYVKLNADALLRMDPQTRSQMLLAQVAGRLLAPSEARALDDRAPFTPDQLAEFDALFGSPNRAPQMGATA